MDTPRRDAPQVTIVGAGAAGMAAALRLVEAGCAVTVYERAAEIGGQYGMTEASPGGAMEHAYHVFNDWCLNYFEIGDAIGLRRDADWAPRPVFKVLRPMDAAARAATGPGRAAADFRPIAYIGSPQFFWANVNSGVADWSDALLYVYSLLDLILDDGLDEARGLEFLNRVSVNGYVRSRPYATDMAALLHQELLLKVFAVPSYETSARAYQTYLRFCAAYPYPSPTFRSLRGPARDAFWVPFRAALDRMAARSGGAFRLVTGRALTRIELTADGGAVRSIDLDQKPVPVPGPLVVAIPPAALQAVVAASPELARRAPELRDLV